MQRNHPAGVLVQVVSDDAVVHGDHLHLREYRHVVRAFRDYGDVVMSRFFAVQLGLFPSDLGRHCDVDRKFWIVLDIVPVVLPVLANPGHGRDQIDHAAWRSWAWT